VTPSSAVSSAASQPSNPCDGSGFVVQSQKLSRVNVNTGALVTIITNMGFSTTALGYNVLDDYVYGTQYYQNPDNEDDVAYVLARIDVQAPGTVTRIGPLSNFWNMGDVDSDGFYWVGQNNQQTGFEWAKIDLRPGSASYGQRLEAGLTATQGLDPMDWMSLPSGGGDYLYTMTNDASLARFSKITKSWEITRSYENVPYSRWGALFAVDSENAIFATDDDSGSIWKFPLDGSNAGLVNGHLDFPAQNGASCRAGKSVLSQAPQGT